MNDTNASARKVDEPVWTDDQLDAALAELYALSTAGGDAGAAPHGGPGADHRAPATEPSPSRRKRRWRWPLLAAIAALVAAAAVVVPSMVSRDAAPRADAAAVLNQAARAAAISAKDEALKPGQYRYVQSSGLGIGGSGTVGKDGNTVMTMEWQRWGRETWIPSDPKAEWLLRDPVRTSAPMDSGTVPAAAAFVPAPGTSGESVTANCGEFFPSGDPAASTNFCTSSGSWQVPSASWLRGLPKDPEQMYQLLRRETAGRGKSPNAEMLVYAQDALGTGLVPAEVRSVILAALAKVPDLAIADRQANLNGQHGVAFTVEEAGMTSQLIVDPATGQFIGTRDVLSADQPQGVNGRDGKEIVLRAGTVVSFTALRTGVADRLGAPPIEQ